METFHDPSSGLKARVSLDFGRFFPSWADVRDVASRFNVIVFPDIPGIQAQMLLGFVGRLHNAGVDERANELAVMGVGTADD